MRVKSTSAYLLSPSTLASPSHGFHETPQEELINVYGELLEREVQVMLHNIK